MTSTTAPTGRPLPAWLKTTLLAAGVFALCWAGAIAYWRSSPAAPATPELLLALLAAPLALLGVLWIGKKAVSARPQAAATPGAAVQPAASATPSVPPLALLAAALRAPHGASPEELAAAIAGNKARPDLDPELVDDDGFPVMSARSDDALDEALQEEISEWLVVNGLAELHLDDAQWRALILGTAVLRDLAGEAFLQLMPQEGTPPQLRLLPILPASWTVEQRHAAGLWFKHTVAQFGWPVDYLTRIDVAVGAAPAAILGQCAVDSQVPHKSLATILLACDSHIAQQTVDKWAAGNLLCTSARAQGCIPGEGAAGMLLTSLEHARQHPDALFAQLYPLLETRREVSSDSAKRPETKRFADLAERAVHAGGLQLAQVGAVAADTDHRASRGLELMGLASLALPQIDASADVLRTGATTGTCGAVPFIAALALARHAALAGNAPVLFVSNDDPFVCNMALVGPPLAPALPA
jgi:hypothetical protein